MPRAPKHRSRRSKTATDARASKPIVFELEPRNHNVPDRKLLADLRAVAKKLSAKTLMQREYEAHGQFLASLIYKRFGSWNAALKAGGLKPSRGCDATAADLLANLEIVWRKLGRQPRQGDMRQPLSEFSHQSYQRRFGGFRNALKTWASPRRVGATKLLIQARLERFGAFVA